MSEYIQHHHTAASMFPMHSAEEYKSLIDDIADNGLLEPIWIHKGQIIDGRNRNKACMELGIPAQYREYEGDNIASFVVSLNVKRRHLTKSQLAMIALDLEKILASEAKERQIRKPVNSVNQRIGEQKPQAAEQAAKALGTNKQYVSDAKKIRKSAPDLEQKVVSGEITLPKAIKEVRKRETIGRLKEIEESPVQPLIGVYDAIVIDPPWPMQKIQRDVRPNQVSLEYPTMTIDEIGMSKQSVNDIFADLSGIIESDNSVLFRNFEDQKIYNAQPGQGQAAWDTLTCRQWFPGCFCSA